MLGSKGSQLRIGLRRLSHGMRVNTRYINFMYLLAGKLPEASQVFVVVFLRSLFECSLTPLCGDELGFTEESRYKSLVQNYDFDILLLVVSHMAADDVFQVTGYRC